MNKSVAGDVVFILMFLICMAIFVAAFYVGVQ